MKKPIFLILFLLLGCASNTNKQIPTINTQMQTVKQNNHTSIDNQELTNKDNNTRLLYYYVPEDSMAQFMSSVRGTFYWQDGCIYLLNFDENKKIIKKTAMFPELPKNAVVWDEKNKVLTLKNGDDVFKFEMGDYIHTNGRSISRIPDNMVLDNKDDEKCLSKDGIAFVGTISIEKIKSQSR